MAELTIRPEEIRDALENFVQSYKPDAASREEVGTVTLPATVSPRSRDFPRPWPTSC
ncbi:ATP synthase subunit alpha [Streptomyces hirsutus]